MKKMPDLTGHKFGRWLVLGMTSSKRKCGDKMTNRQLCMCVCECGTKKDITPAELNRGTTLSCGCARSELKRAMSKYGGKSVTYTAEYTSWRHMMDRCYNVNNSRYKDYGNRGITVCERWHDFENFFADMGERPQDFTLERINNDGEYCPENCKWASKVDQARNKRNNHNIAYEGRTQCVAAWEEELGLGSGVIKARINKYSDPDIQDVLFAPLKSPKTIEYNGDKRTISDWSSLLNIPVDVLYYRLREYPNISPDALFAPSIKRREKNGRFCRFTNV